MSKLLCPKCKVPLEQMDPNSLVGWGCPKCLQIYAIVSTNNDKATEGT